MLVHIESEKQFDEVVKNGKVIVDFYASWCGPCRMIAPILEEIAEEDESLVIAKLDVDEISQVASRYSVASIPTLLFFNDGTLVHEQIGFVPKPTLLKLIETHLQ